MSFIRKQLAKTFYRQCTPSIHAFRSRSHVNELKSKIYFPSNNPSLTNHCNAFQVNAIRTAEFSSKPSILMQTIHPIESFSVQMNEHSVRFKNNSVHIPIQPFFRNLSTQTQGRGRLGPDLSSAGSIPKPLLRNRLSTGYQARSAERSRSTLLYLSALVVAMLGLTYASVPLYRMFCQATGFGGTVKRMETVEDKIAKHEESDVLSIANKRELTVQFNADVADAMPWKFIPTQREVKVKPGQSTLAFYTAQNLSNEPITGVSTYNVTPAKAGAYFNKIQCFCFEEQRLQPNEKIDMPVFFYIDPEFATDPKMKDVNYMTLSYTFFKVEKE